MYQDNATSDPFTLTTPTPTQKPPKRNQFLFRSLVGLAVISGVLIITKPSKSDYDVHIAPTLVGEAQNAYCQGIQLPKEFQGLGDVTGNLCRSAIAGSTTAIGQDRLKEFASNSSNCQNYALVLVCSTEIPGKKISKVGLLRQFFQLPN
jgi:hypothetical protein